MDKTGKIYIAGHRGLVGSAILNELNQKGYSNLITRTHKELDLTDQLAVSEFFLKEKPDYVILAAAKVGGIMANNIYRAQFIYENIQIQNNIIHSSWLNKVKKLLFLGSSCIYPKNAPQPLEENYLLTSPLEYTNEPYAIAKIAGIKMCESYNIQYGTNFIPVMPTNLYGPNDNFDLEKSHVLPAIMRKMHLGKALENNNWETLKSDFNRNPVEGITGNATKMEILEILEKYGISQSKELVSITLWGTGSPKREFLHSTDMASASVFIMENINFNDLKPEGNEIRNTHINIGTGTDLTIKELSGIIQKTTGFQGKIIWDSTKPDGTPQKLMDVGKIHNLGWQEKFTLEQGIKQVYEDYSRE